MEMRGPKASRFRGRGGVEMEGTEYKKRHLVSRKRIFVSGGPGKTLHLLSRRGAGEEKGEPVLQVKGG